MAAVAITKDEDEGQKLSQKAAGPPIKRRESLMNYGYFGLKGSALEKLENEALL